MFSEEPASHAIYSAALSALETWHLIKIPLASQSSQTQYVAQGAVISINSTAFMHNTTFGYYYTSTSTGISHEP